MLDIMYDPQTSGGLLIAVDEKDAASLLHELTALIPCAAQIGYVTKQEKKHLIVEGS